MNAESTRRFWSPEHTEVSREEIASYLAELEGDAGPALLDLFEFGVGTREVSEVSVPAFRRDPQSFEVFAKAPYSRSYELPYSRLALVVADGSFPRAYVTVETAVEREGDLVAPWTIPFDIFVYPSEGRLVVLRGPDTDVPHATYQSWASTFVGHAQQLNESLATSTPGSIPRTA